MCRITCSVPSNSRPLYFSTHLDPCNNFTKNGSTSSSYIYSTSLFCSQSSKTLRLLNIINLESSPTNFIHRGDTRSNGTRFYINWRISRSSIILQKVFKMDVYSMYRSKLPNPFYSDCISCDVKMFWWPIKSLETSFSSLNSYNKYVNIFIRGHVSFLRKLKNIRWNLFYKLKHIRL